MRSRGEEHFGLFSSYLYSLFSRFALAAFYNGVAEDISGLAPKKLLDVGGGNGLVISKLSHYLKKTDFYYVDPSKYMLRIASRRLSKNKKQKFFVELGNSRAIPYKEKFDVIISTISFHHWVFKFKSLKYLLTKLNKGGELRIYEFYKDNLRGLKRGAKAHALSMKEADRYNFKGYKKDIRIINDEIIVLSFKRIR